MQERILPAPDIFATCPQEGKISDYYAGTFDAVYVLLHPFIKVVAIGAEQFRPPRYPSRSSIVRTCTPVSWAEAAQKAGLPSIAAVDVGLRTRIRGLRPELSNQDYADRIESLADSDHVLLPQKAASRTCFMTPCFDSSRASGMSGFGLAMSSAPNENGTGSTSSRAKTTDRPPDVVM